MLHWYSVICETVFDWVENNDSYSLGHVLHATMLQYVNEFNVAVLESNGIVIKPVKDDNNSNNKWIIKQIIMIKQMVLIINSKRNRIFT